MKYKYITVIIILGFVGLVIGTLFKITHVPHADLLIQISSAIIILSLIIAIIKSRKE